LVRSGRSAWDPNAQYNLGVLYDKGRGVSQDYAEAARWYRLAADQEHAWAQYNLGVLYREGHGVPRATHAENLGSDRGRTASEGMLVIDVVSGG
jgi:TPR repeat protein